jgi:hypothetical protein
MDRRVQYTIQSPINFQVRKPKDISLIIAMRCFYVSENDGMRVTLSHFSSRSLSHVLYLMSRGSKFDNI